MKRIYLKDLGTDKETNQVLTTLEVMRIALKFGPAQTGGADFEEQTKRVRIFSVIAALPPGAVHCDLEDADFEKMATTLKAHRWGIADPRLVEIMQALIDSKAPPVVALPVREAAE